jgi:hypothetical protein
MWPLPQAGVVAPCAAAIAKSDRTNTRMFSILDPPLNQRGSKEISC